MGYVSILFFLIGFIFFFSNKKYLSLLAIVILSTGWFGLASENFLIGPIQIQHGDLALLLIFSLIPFRTKSSNKQLNKIRYALLFFLIFLFISIAFDFLFRGTLPMQIFRTTRKCGYFAFLFLIYSFKRHDYFILIKSLIIITAIHSTIYISQYLFGFNFDKSDAIPNEIGGARYRNSPSYLIPMFIYTLFLINKAKIYKWYVLLFLTTIFLAQSRGAIISAGIGILLFLYLNKKINLYNLGIICSLSFLAYSLTINYLPIISERFSEAYVQSNTISDMNYNDLESFYNNGSFIFRIGLTYERLVFVLQNLNTTILGVGFVPDMDIQSSIFTIGTESPMLPTGYEQYNSVDIFLPNIITRYGIVGSIIFLNLIVQLFIYSFKQKKYLFGKILISYLFSMLIISMISETFYNGQNFILIFITIGLVIGIKTKNIPVYSKNSIQIKYK